MITHKIVLGLVALAGVGATPQPGTWQRLPAAPITPEFNARTSVWTGKLMLVFGRDQKTALDAHGHPFATGALNVAAAYDPAKRSWRKLNPPPHTTGFMQLSSIWTGKEMLVWGQGTRLAYNPRTDSWRRLPNSRLLAVHDGFGAVVWTGKEMLGWGGGCCGDAFSDGVAYSPRTNTWRALPNALLTGNQHPVGVWTGKRYILFAGSQAAAYDPVRNVWRRIAAAPVRATAAVWSGTRVLVTTGSRTVFSYDPAKDRWQKLPLLPVGRVGDVATWTGGSLVVWGGPRGGASLQPGRSKSWTLVAHGPLPARLEATAIWTGSSLVVWGGVPTKTWGSYAQAGAVFTPVAGCGDDWMGENLVATPKIKLALRRAYVAAHPGAYVGGPARGHTYYGMYSGTSYAIAKFGGAPTIFRTDGHGLWHVRQDTRGSICNDVVPSELIKVWSLRRITARCYTLPA